jgi:hypothetical protein
MGSHTRSTSKSLGRHLRGDPRAPGVRRLAADDRLAQLMGHDTGR